MSPSKARPVLLALAMLGVQVALGLLLARLYLTSQNTLHNNGRWLATKATMSRSLMGAESFRRERQALARNRLDLGAWHGHHEVVLAEPVTPERILFRFRVEPGAWLAIILDRPARKPATMLRLSANPRRPNALLQVAPSGEFVDKQPMGFRRVAAESWHDVELSYSPESVTARLDGSPLGSFAIPARSERRVGFRGSARSALVDDVEIWSNGRSVFVETFSVPRHASWITLWIVVAVVVVNGLVAGGTRLISTERRATARMALAMVSTTLIVIAAMVLAFLHLRAGSYPFAEDLEAEETRTRTAEMARIRAQVRRKHPPRPVAGVHRILLVGSSQTWGAGAARRRDVWGSALERLLNDDPELDGTFECVNAGVASARSHHLAPVVAGDWLRLEPRTVLITLGTNDTHLGRYEEHLGRIVDSILDAGAGLLLVLEPNSSEYANDGLEMRHAIMRRVGSQRGVPVLDMHDYLRGRLDDGFLWWDLTHLTSFGQLLFAERLHQELVRLGLVG